MQWLLVRWLDKTTKAPVLLRLDKMPAKQTSKAIPWQSGMGLHRKGKG
jgi:hypothetical protein